MGHFKTTWGARFGGVRANFCLRILIMTAGAILVALGIALSKHSCMGTAAISSMPAVFTDVSAAHGAEWMTMGAWTFLLNLLFLLAEIVLLRGEFKPIQVLQLPLFLVLSVAVDAWLWALSFVPADSYPLQAVFLALSIITLALGINLQLAPDLVMCPADAIVQVVSYVSGQPFPKCKVIIDVTLMSVAAAVSFAALGGLHQVREGTIIAALLVGRAVGLWGRVLKPTLAWLIPPSPRTFIAPLIPKDGTRARNASNRMVVEDAEAQAQGAAAH